MFASCAIAWLASASISFCAARGSAWNFAEPSTSCSVRLPRFCGLSASTFSDTPAEVDVWKRGSPLYTAVIECVPTVRFEVWQTAIPLAWFTCCDPHPAIVLVPSSKATVPPSGAGVTVAVNVTCWVASAGLAADTTVVWVPAAGATTEIVLLVAVIDELTVSVAVIACGPALRRVALNVAVPVVSVLFAGRVAFASVLVK